MTAAARLERARRHLDTPPPATVPGQLAVEVERPPRPCEHGNPQCATLPTRPYVCGPRCEAHQPAITRPYYQPRRTP
ncbi:aromatic ring-opening dioxygenase LigA [Streptomyces cyaneofuscatus]|uniref:aromatic ring-opening dioxygenase LigA n=1 Tax=Streptomyces cyaneofuscatus TaxID=66883 RepID=UPI0038677859|nr:aromatic ring-opening dioxygenase LigA [Streptomyces cyaneofuscatus]